MKYNLIIVLLFVSAMLYAQNDSVRLDRDFQFRNGIYTSVTEVLNNSPKYPKVIHNDGSKWPVDLDSIVAIVKNGKMVVNFDNKLQRLILVGSLSTFLIESQGIDWESALLSGGTPYVSQAKTVAEVYCLDFRTGQVNPLTREFMNEILERDKSLQSEFSSLSKKTQRQTLYSYVLKYNSRNPTYIKNK